jgi:hypothetical protein
MDFLLLLCKIHSKATSDRWYVIYHMYIHTKAIKLLVGENVSEWNDYCIPHILYHRTNLIFHCSLVAFTICYDVLHTRWFIGWCNKPLQTNLFHSNRQYVSFSDVAEEMMMLTHITYHWAIILKVIPLSFWCECFTCNACYFYKWHVSHIACCLLLWSCHECVSWYQYEKSLLSIFMLSLHEMHKMNARWGGHVHSSL